jgi:hypothetical protein
MTEEQKPEIWTPPETIDENTRRMAWLLFLEVWKGELRDANQFQEWTDKQASNVYVGCLRIAKIVRAQEQQTTVKVEPDEPGS